ncbi:aa3-type cytochrome oxidase subunit II [Gordonia crocea]|uniref:cytochrome-c oxidase n=2 Tax=Gordonia crocea TaxID=589162 RepID=A0A7I9V0L1_9ACTN|nr:cytochrome c oxidase subunit II [Gordonia crocea]GED98600.1 putative cytochrome c oxidase subunit 2 precursor [Gordonia crocea]
MKLTHGERSTAQPAATASRTVKRVGLVAALGLATLVMTGCGPRETLRFGWPTGVTPEAEAMGHLWTWAVIASLIVGFLVWMAIFYAITFFRHRDGEDSFPRQTAYNMPVELTLITLPFLAIAVLFYFTVVVENKVEKKTDDPAVVVDVTAFQWNWKFGYDKVRQDNGTYKVYAVKDGSPFALQAQREAEHGHPLPLPAGGRSDNVRDYLRFSKIETLGTPSEIPILVLPEGKRIEFNLAAADVVHSFWVPEFLYKRDVMPFPKQNHTDPRFQIEKITRTGAFVGRCAEMCGTYHAMMNFEIRVVSDQDFKSYLQWREKGLTNAGALEAICQVPTSVTTVPFETRRKTGGDTPKHLGDTWRPVLQNCTKRAIGAS